MVRTIHLCLAALIASAAAQPVQAGVVLYDNSKNVFDWGVYWAGENYYGHPYLDVAASPSSQHAEWLSPHTILHHHTAQFSSGDYESDEFIGEADLRIARAGATTITHYGWEHPADLVFNNPRKFVPGESVGPDADFVVDVTLDGHVTGPDHHWQDFDFWGYSPGYIGVVFALDGRTHYGWILVDKSHDNALAWAYESDADTPIAVPIPAPGSITVAAAALSAGIRRRRR